MTSIETIRALSLRVQHHRRDQKGRLRPIRRLKMLMAEDGAHVFGNVPARSRAEQEAGSGFARVFTWEELASSPPAALVATLDELVARAYAATTGPAYVPSEEDIKREAAGSRFSDVDTLERVLGRACDDYRESTGRNRYEFTVDAIAVHARHLWMVAGDVLAVDAAHALLIVMAESVRDEDALMPDNPHNVDVAAARQLLLDRLGAPTVHDPGPHALEVEPE
jgi:hypothetical protein